jgi:hypothetical protein
MSLAAVDDSITAGSSCAAVSGSAAAFPYHRMFALALDAWYPRGSPHRTGVRRQRAHDAHLTDATSRGRSCLDELRYKKLKTMLWFLK